MALIAQRKKQLFLESERKENPEIQCLPAALHACLPDCAAPLDGGHRRDRRLARESQRGHT